MNIKFVAFWVVLSFALLCGGMEFALAQETEEAISLEEEFLFVEEELVVTATKRPQAISEVPAIIDVYTSKQISETGADNLYELLSTLPGIEIMETYYGYTHVQFRGILQTHCSKSSLLLNGQPLYDQIVSSYYLEQIPVSSIERIEVVRGPGGVLYGTNAYAGVINVITKKGKDINGTLVSSRAGTFNSKNVRFAAGKEVDGLDIFFASEYNESDGYHKTVEWDEDDINPTSNLLYGHSFGSRQLGYYPDEPDAYENDYTNVFTSLGYKGFTLNAVYFENEKDKFGIIPTLASTGEQRLQGYGANLKYNANLLEEKLRLTSIVWYDRIKKKERVNIYQPVIRAGGHPDDQDYGGHKTGTQLELNYTLSDRIALLGGGGFEYSHAEPYYFFYTDSISMRIQDEPANAFTSSKNTSDLWAFLQANFQAMENLKILAGSRYNANKQAGGVCVPNLGIVYSPLKELSLKVLYGSGFRNPSFFEKYVRTLDILAGDKNLEPEKNNIIDVGVDYSFSKYSIRVNGFYTKTDNLIGMMRTLTQTDIANLNAEPGYGTGAMTWKKGAMYENEKGKSYNGMEVTVQGAPVSFINFRGNFSYKKGKDTDGNELLFFAPVLANIGATIKPSKMISISANLQYVGERKGNYASIYPWNTWPNAAEGGTDYTIDSYTLLNLKFSIKPHNALSISLIGKNLMDTDYVYPEYIRHAIPYIPGGPGRAVYSEISFKL